MKIKRNLWRAYLKWHESADHYCQDFLSFNRTFKWQYDIKDRMQHSDWKELGLTLSAWPVFQVEIAHAHTLPLLLLAPERAGGGGVRSIKGICPFPIRNDTITQGEANFYWGKGARRELNAALQ